MWSVGLILVLSLATAWGAEICCDFGGCYNDNSPFSHLPLPDCPSTIDSIFNLFTRNNRNNAQSLTRTSIPSQFSGSRMTVFLVHGWTDSHISEWSTNLKNALLDADDVNVVIVGWEKGAGEAFYPKSASNTRAVGVHLGLVMDNIKNNGGSAVSRVYCVGYSLGAHVCGHSGRASGVGRISGLDPAGPSFDSYPDGVGLFRDSAQFVDVIHTHGKGTVPMGTLKVLGHMDFYPNEGGIQPGCTGRVGLAKSGRPHFYGKETEPSGIGCSHDRAPQFFIQSVKNNCFPARQSCTNSENIPGSCSNCNGGNACVSMGYNARGSGSDGIYYLTTGASEPYCQN